MKVGLKLYKHLLALLIVASGVFLALAPQPAHATGEKYLFAYPKNIADDIKSDVEGNKKSASTMSSTSIWVKDGLFKSTQFELPFSTENQNNNEREYVYGQTYDCTNSGLVQGSVIPRDGVKFAKVSLRVRVKLDSNFNNKNLSGFTAVPEFTIKDGNDETKYGPGGRTVKISDLPAACRPSIGSVTITNYHKLSTDAEKDAWSSARSDVERSEAAQAAAANGGGGNDDDACASSDSAGAFAWMLCPMIEVVTSTIKAIQDQAIIPNLKVAPLDPNDGYGKALYTIWENLRNLANAAFVLIFLFIIFANTLSLNVNAYTIKKMLPRLVAAAILVQFSFVFTAIAIDIGNILGAGVAGLIDFSVTGTLAGDNNDFSDVAQGILAVGATAGIIAAIGIPTIVVLLVGGLISLLGLMFTLVARKLIISLLVVLSPLAFAAWVLPGTEKAFKMWYQNLIKVILMYPIIILLLSLSTLLSGIASDGGQFEVILASLFPIIAFLMIPMTFKWAGSLMNMSAGKLDQFTGKTKSSATSGIKNSRPMKAYEQNKQMRSDLKLGNALGATTFMGSSKLGAVRRWGARTAITGAPLGGRYSSDGGWGNPSNAAKQQLDARQQELWKNAQGTMNGDSVQDLESKLKGRNITQAAAAAGELAERGRLNGQHLGTLQTAFKGNPEEAKRAFGYAQNQIKDRAANPVLSRAKWDDIDPATGRAVLDDKTTKTIIQTTTPKSLGSLTPEGLTDLKTATVTDKDGKDIIDPNTGQAKTMLSHISTDTIEKAVTTNNISNTMNPDVKRQLNALLQYRKQKGI